jgi:hypothetical protein
LYSKWYEIIENYYRHKSVDWELTPS